MICLPEADALGRRLIHRPTLQGWLDPGSSQWSAWLTVFNPAHTTAYPQACQCWVPKNTFRMPSLRRHWRVSEPHWEKVQAAQQGGHQAMTGTSLEEASYKDPPAVERNYFEQDPQPTESTNITARSLEKHHGAGVAKRSRCLLAPSLQPL